MAYRSSGTFFFYSYMVTKNKVPNEPDPNVLSEDNNIKKDNDIKTIEHKNTKLDELIQEFEDLKSKLLSKEQFDYTKES